jgi:arylsulfatase A-like enzyme
MMDQERAASSRLEDVAVIASWEKIEKAATFDPERMVVTTGRSRVHNAAALLDDAGTRDWLERGAQADPFPGFDDYRPDRFTAGLALRYLETKHPRLMFVGLGEPDEYCHRGAYAGYLASLRAADDFVGDLFAALGRMGERGRNTTVLVTADHGRGKDYRHHGRNFPESSRVWLVALGGAVEARGLATSAMPHHLADVAPTVRAILDLPADDARSAGAPLRELFAPPAQATALRY